MNPENLKYTVGTPEFYNQLNTNIPKEQLSYEEKLFYLNEKVETGNLSKEELGEVLAEIAHLKEHKEEYDKSVAETDQFKAVTRK